MFFCSAAYSRSLVRKRSSLPNAVELGVPAFLFGCDGPLTAAFNAPDGRKRSRPGKHVLIRLEQIDFAAFAAADMRP